MLYRDKQTEFDPLTNPTLLRALLSRAITMTGIWLAGSAFLTVILLALGQRPPVVVADAGYGDTTAFRLALTQRSIGYVVAIKGHQRPPGRCGAPHPAPHARSGAARTPPSS